MQKISIDLSNLSTQFQRVTDSNRVETGALQFNEDWPGIFIRGDNAMYFKMHLQAVLKATEANPSVDFITRSSLKSLVDLLDSCAIVHSDEDTDVGC